MRLFLTSQDCKLWDCVKNGFVIPTEPAGEGGSSKSLPFASWSAAIKARKTLESKAMYQIPDGWPYQEAQKLFKEPLVVDDEEQMDLKWTALDEEGLITFLVNENGFNSDWVAKAIEKIKAAKNKGSHGRLESFFKPAANNSAPIKRKETSEGTAKQTVAKKPKGGAGRKKK